MCKSTIWGMVLTDYVEDFTEWCMNHRKNTLHDNFELYERSVYH